MTGAAVSHEGGGWQVDRPSEDPLVIVRFGINEEGVDSWDMVIETVAAKAR